MTGRTRKQIRKSLIDKAARLPYLVYVAAMLFKSETPSDTANVEHISAVRRVVGFMFLRHALCA